MKTFKKLISPLIAPLVLALAAGAAQAEQLPRLVLAGPLASVSNPLVHMVETGALAEVAEQVEFVTWRDPDQLRVLALEGKADFIAMPTNVAANLYNRGAPVGLLNVSTWGVLWLVSRNGTSKSLADFKGKEIAMPFRADMPDIVFSAVAEAQGLNVRNDFRLRYVASPMDAMQLLLARRVDHALLSEPSISIALRKNREMSAGEADAELHRSVDLQKEWGRVFQREARIPQAGIAALGPARDKPALVARFQTAYAASLKWCNENADACSAMVARRMPALPAAAIADSLRVGQNRFVPAQEAKAELEAFYGVLLERQPALVGGKLPPADFYRGK